MVLKTELSTLGGLFDDEDEDEDEDKGMNQASAGDENEDEEEGFGFGFDAMTGQLHLKGTVGEHLGV